MRFTDRDLANVRVAAAPDPMWEITNSLDRLQTRIGRQSFEQWYRKTLGTLANSGFDRTVRSMLIPMLPRAAYFPDFLTPTEAREGIEAGLDAILRTPNATVTAEIKKLDTVRPTPKWAMRVADKDLRQELVSALRAYYDLAIAPHDDLIQASFDRDRAIRARALLGGVGRLFESFRPLMRWVPPVLEVGYPVHREINLDGRGLLLVPSYFCWRHPVALVDPDLPPVLIYPTLDAVQDQDKPRIETALANLLGSARAAVLACTRDGMTTGEIAKIVGISAPTVSHHLNRLRNSDLITSHRLANTMLHVLTPRGVALLKPRE